MSSRRVFISGVAWSIPAVAIATAAPAFAASSGRAAIDAAFAEIRSSPMTAYWTEITGGNLNSTAKTVAFNINNYSSYDLVFQQGTALAIKFDIINSDGSAFQRTGLSSASTSWGTENDVTAGSTTNPRNQTVAAGTVNWTIASTATTSRTLLGQDGSADNTGDIAISVPGNTIIKTTLVQVPRVKPSLADIKAAYPGTLSQADINYYNNLAAIPMTLRIAGPSMSGSRARYGQQNQVTQDTLLQGGSGQWGVGGSYWSNAVGNYIHNGSAGSSPSVSGPSYSTDGIF